MRRQNRARVFDSSYSGSPGPGRAISKQNDRRQQYEVGALLRAQGERASNNGYSVS